uniref:Uncharacterized protein n=1 Tax=Lutzomyia longipalpis TaxID=7200 RepID=A0A1B0CKC4_LUTLO
MIVEGCRVNLRDRRDEETYDIPRLKSPISRRIYEPITTLKAIRKFTSPTFGVHSCPGRGRQTLCQQFNNEILSEHLQKVKSAHSVEDFRKLLERIQHTKKERISKRSLDDDQVNVESQDILVPERENPPNTGATPKYPRKRRSEEEGRYIEEWISKLAVNCYDEGLQAHLKFLEECTTRLTKKDLQPHRETSSPLGVKRTSGRGYRISVKIHGSRMTSNDHRDANLIETFTRLDVSRGNAPQPPPPKIVLNDDFTNSVDFARCEHFTSSRQSREGTHPPDVGESLKTLKVPSLVKIAVEERPTHSRKFSR